MLPYARQLIEDDDIAAVVAVLKSDWLAHGPTVVAFERAFAEAVGAAEAVACSSGTAALQLALNNYRIGEGNVCMVPAVTFLSTATAPHLMGAQVSFADVDPETGLLIPETLADAAGRGPHCSVVLPVHLGGRSCDMPALRWAAEANGISYVVEDAAHALGTVLGTEKIGACAHSDLSCFSLHAIKTVAAGEGGMITLNDPERARRLRLQLNHGVTRDVGDFEDAELSLDSQGRRNPWSYEQQELAFNLRMDEMSAALGLSQLGKLRRFKARRQELAAAYDAALAPLAAVVRPVVTPEGQDPCLHLYQVLIDFDGAGIGRADVMRRMAEDGVATQVHYIPVYRQPYFRDLYGEQRLPGAEAFYARVLALPLFPAMADGDVERVVEALMRALG